MATRRKRQPEQPLGAAPHEVLEQGKPQIYGKKYPIQDCRSYVCYDGWLYYNGCIAANRINSYDAKTGKPNGVIGVPAGYTPAALPLHLTPAAGGSRSDRWFHTTTRTRCWSH